MRCSSAAAGAVRASLVKSAVGPTAPSNPGGGGSVTLTTPAPVSPVNGEQLSTLRPTLTVQNTTSSSQSGTRMYEFQISDRTDFSLGSSLTSSFIVAVSQTGVPEGSDGRTSFTAGQELQPATRMYWRARAVQGSTSSEWSSPAMFRTKFVGYNRPGELYDPLIHRRNDRYAHRRAHVCFRQGHSFEQRDLVRSLSVGTNAHEWRIFRPG